MTGLVIWVATAAIVPSPSHVRELIDADKWREAVEEARALALSSPEDLDAATCLGEALYRAGRIEEAGVVLDRVAAHESAPARAQAQLGLVRSAEGRGEEAVALLEAALRAAPEDPWVLYRASGAARTRAEASRLLEAYLARSVGEDPDRVEGARGTLRLYGALGERRVWIAESRPDRVEVPLKPLVGTASRGFVVEARLAGKKTIRLLLDTGSTGLFVVERAVKKAGFKPLAEETVFAGGGTGRAKSSRGVLPTFAIGGLVFKDALVTTTGEEFDAQGRIHGVLGISALDGYQITLDLDAGRLVLEPAGGEPAGEPYWSVGGQMLVRASAKGAPGDGLFLFDTGATRSMVGASYAATIADASETSAATVRTYGGNVADAVSMRGVTLHFSGASAGSDVVNRSDLTHRSRLGGVEVSGFLGLDVLEGTVIRIDTTRQRVSATPGRGRR